MQHITPEVIDNLLNTNNQTCISIYMPTEKKGDQQRQNPIRFKNLINKAREELAASQVSNHQIKESLSAAEKKLDDEDFWNHQKLGLAVFINESDQLFFQLPLDFSELVMVGTRYHVKPLMPLVTTNGKFFILTLSQNDVKLYQATRTSIDKVFLGDIPRSMEDYLKDYEVHKGIQFRSAPGPSGQGKAGVFHGQGGGDEDFKKDVQEYLNLVENGITELLNGQRAPLVLVGVEYMTSMYSDLNKYSDLAEETIEGNFEHLTKDALHDKAWTIVRPIFKERERVAIEAYQNNAGTGKTSCDLEEIVVAAHDGRIDNLFVTRDLVQWGEYDFEGRKITLHDDKSATSQDLYDLAAFKTLQNDGRVYSMKPEEMIEGCQIAAVFRY